MYTREKCMWEELKMFDFFKPFRVYDWITLFYIIVAIACFVWTSIGNDYVFGKIEKRSKENRDNIVKKRECDIYYLELRKSWMRNQNIWIAVEYFLVGLSYLSMVIVLYMSVDNLIKDQNILQMKTTIYTIINLLSSAFRDYLNPKKKSLGARNAYLKLNKAILEYEVSDDPDVRNLITAFDDGEKLMTESTYMD